MEWAIGMRGGAKVGVVKAPGEIIRDHGVLPLPRYHSRLANVCALFVASIDVQVCLFEASAYFACKYRP